MASARVALRLGERSRRAKLSWVLLLATFLASASTPGSAHAQVPAIQISQDTLQGSGDSQNDTQAEPHIAVDPNHPSVVVAVFQEGRFPDGGAVAVGYAASRDGGKTWTTGDLPSLTIATGGPFERATDPVVAFGPNGAVYAQTLAFGGARSAIAVQRSDDNGETFNAPVLAHDDTEAAVFNDKNWIAVDTFPSSPYFGRVYAAWDQSNSVGAPLLLRYSDDRGTTWSPLITVSAPTARTVGVIPLVQRNGDLTLVYDDYTSGEQEVSRTSHNGGKTFDAAVKIDDFRGGVLRDIRTGALPAAAVDRLDGDLYVVWQDQRFRSDGLRDIVLSRSTAGTSWSALVRVNSDAPNSGLDHFTPAVAALNGRVHVTYRTRDASAGLSSLVDLRYSVSLDRGATFGGERVVGSPTDLRFAAQVTSSHCTNPPCFFLGDYMGVAVSEDTVHPVWCRAFQNPAAPTGQHQTTWSSAIGSTCGDGVIAFGEACDGVNAAACPGLCQADCTCPCTNEVEDLKASVVVKTRREAGILNVKLVVPLAAYRDEAVTVRLDDSDSQPIAMQNVGTLPPKGKTGKQWQYKVRPKGLQQVLLKDLSPRKAGMFQIIVKATKWFTAAAADQPAADTAVTVTIGSQCFRHVATKKTD